MRITEDGRRFLAEPEGEVVQSIDGDEGLLRILSIIAEEGPIATGETLVLFPEGTRSPAGGKHPFRRGAAHVALEARRDVLPVLVTCTPPVLGKRQRWWRIPPRAFELRLRVLDPVPIADYARADLPTPLAARMLTRALDELFAKELQRALGESAS